MAIVYFFVALLSLIAIGLLALLGCNYVIDGAGLHPLIVTVGISVMGAAGVYAIGELEEAVG